MTSLLKAPLTGVADSGLPPGAVGGTHPMMLATSMADDVPNLAMRVAALS